MKTSRCVQSLTTFWAVTIAILVFAAPAMAAEEVEATSRTGIYVNQGGKLQKLGEAKPRQRFRVIGRTKTGTWLRIDVSGRQGWISQKKVRTVGARGVASYSDSGQSNGSLFAYPAFQTQSIGIGFGGGGAYRIPISALPPNYRFDVGMNLVFSPGPSTSFASGTTTVNVSVSVLEIMLLPRLMAEVSPKFEVGGELGLIYLKYGYSDSINNATGGTDITTSEVSIALGGVASYQLDKAWRLTGGLRLLMLTSMVAQFHAGVEFRI